MSSHPYLAQVIDAVLDSDLILTLRHFGAALGDEVVSLTSAPP
jgi:hypothetical protein